MRSSSAPPARPARRLGAPELLAQRSLFRVIHAFAWQAFRRLRVPVRDRADLVQDVMLALYRRHETYNPDRGVPAAWVQGFIVNVARAYLRRERPEEMLVIDDAEDEIWLDPSPIEAEVELDELRRILHDELLPRVPFEQRVIVLARDVDGLEMRDIAEQLEIPLSTAYDRYQRGRAALERAHARWEARRRDRGLLLFPITLGQILERDWPVPPVPPGIERAAWARLRASMLGQAALALLRRPATRLALTFATGTAFGATALVAARPPPPVTTSFVPLPYPVTVMAPPVRETAAPPVEPALTVEPAPPEPVIRAKHPPPPASEPVPREEPLVAEQRLFEAARQAFSRDDLGAALDALSAHERAFPAGDFANEREILWIKTLIRAGRSDDARARLERLRRSEAGKALAERIEGYVPSLRSGR